MHQVSWCKTLARRVPKFASLINLSRPPYTDLGVWCSRRHARTLGRCEGPMVCFSRLRVQVARVAHIHPFKERSSEYMISRTILSTKNEYVDDINNLMIDRFPEEDQIYYSFDSAEDDNNSNYPTEFLNSLKPGGLPPHLLKLKLGCPIMLLRNIDLANGLCNGTRLVCKGFQKNVIDAEIAVGEHAGRRVFLSQIPLFPSDNDMFPFKMKRKQFSIRLSFAMTINKAQGQTIPHVGVYLHDPVFSHGQLYEALSRGTSRMNTKILIKPIEKVKQRGIYTSNVVYQEVLQDE